MGFSGKERKKLIKACRDLKEGTLEEKIEAVFRFYRRVIELTGEVYKSLDGKLEPADRHFLKTVFASGFNKIKGSYQKNAGQESNLSAGTNEGEAGTADEERDDESGESPEAIFRKRKELRKVEAELNRLRNLMAALRDFREDIDREFDLMEAEIKREIDSEDERIKQITDRIMPGD